MSEHITEASGAEPTDEAIARRAHEIWESEGQPAGRNDEHWHRARRELIEEEGEAPAALQQVQPGFAETQPGYTPEPDPDVRLEEGPGARFAQDVSDAPEEPKSAPVRKKRSSAASGAATTPTRRKRSAPIA